MISLVVILFLLATYAAFMTYCASHFKTELDGATAKLKILEDTSRCDVSMAPHSWSPWSKPEEATKAVKKRQSRVGYDSGVFEVEYHVSYQERACDFCNEYQMRDVSVVEGQVFG